MLQLINCVGLGDQVAVDVLCSPLFRSVDQGYSARKQVANMLGHSFPLTDLAIIDRHVGRKYYEYVGKLKAASFDGVA